MAIGTEEIVVNDEPDIFPNGTKVGLYRRSNWPAPTYEPTGKPPGEPEQTATVDESGNLKFTIKLDVFYWAAAEVESEWRYRSIGSGTYYYPGEALEVAENAVAKPVSPGTFTQTFSTAARTHAKGEVATNLPTNLNVVTTLLGTLVGEVNTTNSRVNQTAEAVNEVKGLVNALVDELQALGIVK